MVRKQNVSHRHMFFNYWPPVGGAVLEDSGTFKKQGLTGGSGYLGVGF